MVVGSNIVFQANAVEGHLVLPGIVVKILLPHAQAWKEYANKAFVANDFCDGFAVETCEHLQEGCFANDFPEFSLGSEGPKLLFLINKIRLVIVYKMWNVYKYNTQPNKYSCLIVLLRDIMLVPLKR